MSSFESRLQRGFSPGSEHIKMANIAVADTMDMGRLWFEDHGVQFTAADLLRYAEMVLVEEQRREMEDMI